MRYFEFNTNKFDYCALIGAKSKKEAINFYKEVVSDEQDNFDYVEELKMHEAIERSYNALKGELNNEEILKMYMECEAKEESMLMLVDEALL